jgi:HK97 family phage portal protein
LGKTIALILRLFGKEIISTEHRDEVSNLKDPKAWLLKVLGMESLTGVTVSQETALTYSAVWASVRVLSETLAMMPGGIFKKEGEARKSVPEHPAYRLIFQKPNALMTTYKWREVCQAQVCLNGNSYSFIVRDGSARPVELRLIEKPSDVLPFIFNHELYYKVTGYAQPFRSDEIFHVRGLTLNGIEGMSVIKYAREVIGGGLAQQEYSNRLFGSGLTKKVGIKTPQKLDPDVKDSMQKQWDARHAGLENAKNLVFLEAGTDAIELGINPEDAQFLESKQFSVEEVARWFRVPQHMIGKLDRSTNNNIEMQNREFIDYTMMPWFTNWEAEINDKLLTEKEKGIYFSRFNVNALLRGDSTARSAFYEKMKRNGLMSANEIRALEDMNPYDGGDEYWQEMNMMNQEQMDLMIEKLKKELKNAGGTQVN